LEVIMTEIEELERLLEVLTAEIERIKAELERLNSCG